MYHIVAEINEGPGPLVDGADSPGRTVLWGGFDSKHDAEQCLLLLAARPEIISATIEARPY